MNIKNILDKLSKGMNIISQDEWILYSGCHVRICFKKQYFDSFQEEKT